MINYPLMHWHMLGGVSTRTSCSTSSLLLPYPLHHLSSVQCNILFSARRHKLQLFTGFRRWVVVVFPSADEWRRRLSQHQMSDREQIPETALLKLQGLTYVSGIGGLSPLFCASVIVPQLKFSSFSSVSCSLPEQQSDLLEELMYVELPQEQAQALLQEYKDEARRLLPPIPTQDKKKPRLNKKRPHPHGPRPSHRMQWTGQCNKWKDVFWESLYFQMLIVFIIVFVGLTDVRLNMQSWKQQPRYVSVVKSNHNTNLMMTSFGAVDLSLA